MSQRGPFDRSTDSATRGDRSTRPILIGMGLIGLVLILLVLSPISPFSNGDSDGEFTAGSDKTTIDGVSLPRVPEGFEALSRQYEDLSEPKDKAQLYSLTVRLVRPISDSRGLGLYSFQGGQWVRLSDGTLVHEGNAVQGEVAEIPSNIAVLRRITIAIQISGWLPSAARADPKALAVLTTVNPAGFSPAADGSLVGAQAQVPDGNALVVPAIRARSEDQIAAVNTILESPSLREIHINALVQLSLQATNAGIELDYRDVNPARRADLGTFLTVLADRLHQSNRSLSLTLPAPIKAGIAWDTGAYDWERLAALVDTIKLVPEPDPSLYYEKMEAVLEFLQPSVDMNKVLLIVSRASTEKSGGDLVQRSLFEGLAIASTIEVQTASEITSGTRVVLVGKNIFEDDGATGLRWDETAFAVSFSYPDVGGQRTVWLENILSLAFRIDLAQRYGLGGIAVDDISLDPAAPDIWAVLDAYADTLKIDLIAPNDVMLRPIWQIEAGRGDAGSKGNIVWTAPDQAGTYEISLVVSDGVIRAQQKIVLEVLLADDAADSDP